MSEQLSAVSPTVLKWARTSLGLQIHDVAQEMGKDQTIIERWETGEEAPTYAQLERLAYVIYKRPLAAFFLPEPPPETDVKAEFRTYLGAANNKLEKDTLLAMREARVRQINLAEFAERSDVARQFLVACHGLVNSEIPLRESAAAVRERLGVSEAQIAETPSSDAAFEVWRASIEQVGIFIFKRAFKQSTISGFCLRDDQFPLIYINNKTSFTRQTFTAIHELCHLALDVSGVCAIDLEYSTRLAPTERKTEEMCDAFASEVLVPAQSFIRSNPDPSDIESLKLVARRFRVSPAVVARKCFDTQLIDRTRYRELMEEFFPDNWRTRSVEGGGGDYYNTQLQYLSKRYLLEAYRKHSTGQLSDQAFADYLGVKVASLAGLETRLLSRGAG